MSDPVAKAIDCMLDHMHAVDEKLEMMCKRLKQAGIDLEKLELPELAVEKLEGEEERENVD
jgi:serine O-acetyltransferase